MFASLDAIRACLRDLPGPGLAAAAKASEREPQLTKPAGSLGRLEEISHWLATWQDSHPPRAARILTLVFAGNHGVAARGVSAFPPEVTVQMVGNFKAGGAAINQICGSVGADLGVVALSLDTPTADFTTGPAMTEAECLDAFNAGAKALPEDGLDLLCLGEMGIANTTSAAALCHCLFGDSAGFWTGPGTGVTGAALAQKTVVVAEAVSLHKDATNGDALETLRRLGGRELAAIAGAVLEARRRRIPVMLDGFICTAAAAVLHAAQAGALDHCMVGHASQEPGHRRLLNVLGKRAILELDMRLGEASGATLAAGIVKVAAACHTGMATFAEAAVSAKGA